VTGTPSPAEIADLLAWARRLTEAGRIAEATDRAAYLATKTNLLARIADCHPHDHMDKDTQ
jgi:hypothetical protein